ncbi:tRNA epoxyqueuosine(34) reductase QueG [Anaerolineae bacterium CFX9]|nr:tRNA epoxyqueuosine(34) reductase QueG [Anaerolineae bacterium CFX9]
MSVISSAGLKGQALALGFNLVGVTHAVPSPMLAAYERWVAAGMHGSMQYMARADRVSRRRDLQIILPGAQSLIVVGVDYRSHMPEALLNDPSRGRIAMYAWGMDYHDVIGERLEAFAAWLAETSDTPPAQRIYVDTGAILERSHAHQAGLGFTGKNTMLIHPRRGSYFFLGEILTTLAIAPDQPAFAPTMCGSCTRCLNACPTDAFPAPHVLDARRCISYLTIEHKGWIDPALRRLMGNWVFGCDVCQEVCPFQRFAPPTDEPLFVPVDEARAAPRLADLLALDDDAFRMRFAGSPVERIRRERLVRNACIAAGNSGDFALIDPLLLRLDDPSPLVRGHAAWALMQLAPEPAAGWILRLRDDPDEEVQAEMARLSR